MPTILRSSVASAIFCALIAVGQAQTGAKTPPSGAGNPASTPHKSAPWKRYCQPDNGFCFKYPSSWSMLGEVFEGNGVVVAPEQKGERSLWSEITVALVVPPPEGDEEAIGLDALIEQTMKSLREEGQNFETLQRQRRTVDHNPAQMLKVRYREKATGHDWYEEIIFIQGPDDEVYSVALKSTPQDMARLEPLLTGVVGSWMLPEVAAPAEEEQEESPKKPAAEKPGGNAAAPHQPAPSHP